MDTTPTPSAPPPTTPSPSAPVVEDRTVAIIAYLTLLGFIAAIIMHSNKKTQLGAFHLRQMLGIVLGSVLCMIPFLGILVFLCMFVFWIIGFISAIQGKMKPTPLVGPLFQKWFANTFT